MVERARFRDRLYFCSDSTAAGELGISRRTVIRARARLEEAGRIVRQGRRKIGGCKATVVYFLPFESRRRFVRVTQRPSAWKKNKQLHYVKLARAPKRDYGRMARWRTIRRGLAVGDVVPTSGVPPERPNVAVGQALFAAVIDQLTAMGVEQVPRRPLTVAVKQGKEALEDGVDPEIVLIGCVMAIQKGTPQYTSHVILDCVLAKAGKKMSPTQYSETLNSVSRSQNPAVQRFRQVTEEIRQREEQKKLERET
jgi:DNA-binding Lrp family transcriptional regulator